MLVTIGLIKTILYTVMCLGLNIIIDRLGLDSRWKYAVMALNVANEIRGVFFAYESVQYMGWL